MSRLTQGGTAKLVSRGQILKRERGQGNIHVPCSADDEQDWQPYPVDPYSAISDDHTYSGELGHSDRVGQRILCPTPSHACHSKQTMTLSASMDHF